MPVNAKLLAEPLQDVAGNRGNCPSCGEGHERVGDLVWRHPFEGRVKEGWLHQGWPGQPRASGPDRQKAKRNRRQEEGIERQITEGCLGVGAGSPGRK